MSSFPKITTKTVLVGAVSMALSLLTVYGIARAAGKGWKKGTQS